MIVRAECGQLCLTEQTEHARMAAELVGWWGGVCAPVEPADAVKLAVALHDAGWAEVDASPQVNPDTGRPYSFLDIPQDVHVAAHTRTVRRARQADPYAGLLTSLHSAGLYRNRYGHLPHIAQRPVAPQWREAVDRFLAEQDAVQEELTAALRPDPAVLWTHYRWFQLWDMLSLYSCMFSPGDTPDTLLCTVPRGRRGGYHVLPAGIGRRVLGGPVAVHGGSHRPALGGPDPAGPALPQRCGAAGRLRTGVSRAAGDRVASPLIRRGPAP